MTAYLLDFLNLAQNFNPHIHNIRLKENEGKVLYPDFVAKEYHDHWFTTLFDKEAHEKLVAVSQFLFNEIQNLTTDDLNEEETRGLQKLVYYFTSFTDPRISHIWKSRFETPMEMGNEEDLTLVCRDGALKIPSSLFDTYQDSMIRIALYGEWKEKNNPTIELLDFSVESVQKIINCLKGKSFFLEFLLDESLELLRLANFLGLDEIEAEIKKHVLIKFSFNPNFFLASWIHFYERSRHPLVFFTFEQFLFLENFFCHLFHLLFYITDDTLKTRFKELLESYPHDDDNIKTLLAYCYYRGFGTEKDDSKAVELFQETAYKKNPMALHCLGFCYENGIVVEKNETEAIKLYEQSAEQGFCCTHEQLAYCYKKGIGVIRNQEKSVEYYLQAAKEYHPTALHQLGIAYTNGIGTEKDEIQGTKFFKLAVELNCVCALNPLGYAYLRGIGTAKDAKKAVQLFEQALEKNPSDFQALDNLGVVYLEGGIGVDKDEKKAVEFFQKSANGNYACGQYNLARCHLNGTGIEQNRERAIELVQLAARSGLLNAQKSLTRVGLTW